MLGMSLLSFLVLTLIGAVVAVAYLNPVAWDVGTYRMNPASE